MHDDALVQVAVLRKKIAASKERAQALVNMIDRRITYLCKLWDEYMAKEDDNEIVQLAKTAVNEPLRIGLNEVEDARFLERVNSLKDKIAELMLLDEQAAEAHKRAAEDNRTLTMAARRLKETEEHHKALLESSKNQHLKDDDPIFSLQKAIAALEKRASATVNAEEKADSTILVGKLHEYLAKLPPKVMYPGGISTITPGPTSATSTGIGGTTASSSGISGTTVPTNETSSFFTTSSLPSTSVGNVQQIQTKKWSNPEMEEVTARSGSFKSDSGTKNTSTTGI